MPVVNRTRPGRQDIFLTLALVFLHHFALGAQAPVNLGTAATYGVLGGTTVTSTGATLVKGDLGVSPGTAVTGSPGVTGTLHAGDSAAAQAQADVATAYADALGRTAGAVLEIGDLGGQTLSPGLYTSLTSLTISSGDLTLVGDANAVWIFQMGTTFGTAAGRRVILSGGAQPANIFWQVGSSATVGANSDVSGTIMAAQSITIGAGATLEGRALARGAAVTLSANVITVPPRANAAGTVVAWGDDSAGETSVPSALSGVIAISAGEFHTAVLKNDGTVVVWGGNLDGETNVPAYLTNVVAISAGESFTVALNGDGTVAAWGKNDSGQSTVPPGLNGVISVSGGESHTVVLKQNGTVLAWGNNSTGQTNVPAGLSGVTAISAGGGHTMALKSDGTVVAWGAGSFFLQSTVPVGLSGVTAIAAGFAHSVALKSDGTVVAWGDNLLGQAAVPAGLSGVIAIAAGKFHTAALKSDGTVVAWGLNDSGETIVPAGLGGVTAIATGWSDTVALIGPIISRQPVGQTFSAGGEVILSVSALGAGLTYQWQFNGTSISGATNPTLDLGNLTAKNAGTYSVVISSAAGGSVTSQDTVLLLLSFGQLNFYAGITLAGTVGQEFRVDYADVVNNGTTNWLALTTVTLPMSPYLVIDPNSPGKTKRFYRAVPLQ